MSAVIPLPQMSFTPANQHHQQQRGPAQQLSAQKEAKRNHARVYQACESCRQHKTKCDRGDPDEPLETCRRCKREGKNCDLAPTRSKSNKIDADNSSPFKRPRLNSSAQHSAASSNGGYHHLNKSPHDFAEASKKDIRSAERHVHGSKAFQANSTVDQGTALNTLRDYEQRLAKYSSFQGTRRKPTCIPMDFDIYRPNPTDCQQRTDARRAWKRLSFVREGLFTADQAVNYVQKFYMYLLPLTPIILPEKYLYQQHHDDLISDDPILTITILTIASRYFKPANPNSDADFGADLRGNEIHSQLWITLKNLMSRMFWAEELTGAGSMNPESPNANNGLRSVGSCKSLLLLTEWHTRGLHYTPNDHSNGLILPRPPPIGAVSPEVMGFSPEKRRIHDWYEPCRRSDRMCWSLITNAVTIAMEAGVFNPDLEINETTEEKQYCARLLDIYVRSTGERLALHPIIPELPSRLKAILDVNDHKSAERQNEGKDSHVLWHWHEVTRVLCQGNEELFMNKEKTQRYLEDGQYFKLVEKYDTQLNTVWTKLKDCSNKVVNQQIQMLELELQYARVRINSIALEAVFARVTASTPTQREPGLKFSDTISKSILSTDRECIGRIVDASLRFLSTVDDLCEAGQFKFLPVRTFFRIVATSMMLMRCFFTGLGTGDTEKALGLLQKTAKALKLHTVDDLHVGHDIGRLLSTLIKSVQQRLVMVSQHPNKHPNEQNQVTPVIEPGAQRTTSVDQSYDPRHSITYGANGPDHGDLQDYDLDGFDEWDLLNNVPTMKFDAQNSSFSVPRPTMDQPDSYYSMDWSGFSFVGAHINSTTPWEMNAGGAEILDSLCYGPAVEGFDGEHGMV